MNTRISLALAASLVAAVGGHAAAADSPKAPYNSDPTTKSPLPAAEAAKQWKWPAGFEVSVFAAEPDVHQPIAMAVDYRGRLWVAECYTYSEHRTGFAKDLRDRIVIFEDTDGDGRHDKRTVFLDGLERLTSVELGFGGVWVLASPNLIFIPDRDGDDRPDGPAETLVDGFEWKVNHHTIPNGLRWGPDGWLYGRHGIQGHSQLGRPGTPLANRVKMNVGIWRYHPQRKTIEVVAEGTTNPWGMDWNEVGEGFFINTVIGHLWHIIPGAHYRRMYGNDYNPNIYQVIEQTADHVHWAAGEAWNDWQKLGTTSATSAAGGGHAHTGLMFYAGDNWPDEWRGKLLTINFNGKRLNVENVVRRGSGYVAKHQPDTGFVADPFFRGIDLLYGPDGGVFIADWSDTGECHDNEGVHRLSGRIYKVTYGKPQRPAVSDVAKLSPKELLPLLEAKNEIFARQARRRFQELAVSGVALDGVREPLLEKFEKGSGSVAKLRALWSLHAIGAANAEFLRTQLGHSDEYVRGWAVRLLLDDRKVAENDSAMHSAFVSLANKETAASVRLALASGLQRLPVDKRAAIARPLLAHEEDAKDQNLPLMLWYGIEPLGDADPATLAKLAGETAMPIVSRFAARRLMESDSGRDSLAHLLARSASSPVAADVLQGMLEALKGQRAAKPPKGWAEAAPRLAANSDATVRERFRLLGNVFGDPLALEATRKVALDRSADSSTRRTALRSLIDARASGLRATCESLLTEPKLTATAAAGLALETDPAIAGLLLRQFASATISDRQALLGVLLSRPAWAGQLLDAVIGGQVPRSALNAFHARQIRGFKNAALDTKAAAIWGELRDSSAEKLAAMERWKQKLASAQLKSADRKNGRKVYQTVCGACHVLNGEGVGIGPELTGSNRDNLDYLLQNIVDPSSVVAKDYQLSNFTMKDGRVLSGFVRSQNDRTVTIQTIGESTTVPLSDIEERSATSLSMMPEGLLEALPEKDARDLVAYLMDK
jgi:putative membrane-bound dehydrogenase-like protein